MGFTPSPDHYEPAAVLVPVKAWPGTNGNSRVTAILDSRCAQRR